MQRLFFVAIFALLISEIRSAQSPPQTKSTNESNEFANDSNDSNESNESNGSDESDESNESNESNESDGFNGFEDLSSQNLRFPSGEDFVRVLFLKGYNTRLVVLSVSLLGFSCALVGGFLLLRKRALMGDVLSHATLPGICLAFVVMIALGGSGKALSGLLIGAAITGVLGFGTTIAIQKTTRIKSDAAMGIVLSVFFGAGAVLRGMIQKMPETAAGLDSFIYGKTASMVWGDFLIVSGTAIFALLVSILLFKEFRLLCFDEGFAASQGWSVGMLDTILLALVTMVTVAGLQAVGLILVIAFLIMPAAAARFWTNRLGKMLAIGAILGGMGGWMGAAMSGLFPRFPAGAIIVLGVAAFFVLSMLFGTAGGVWVRVLRQKRLKRKMGRQHLLRAAYEWLEARASHFENAPIQIKGLLASRSWSARALRREIRLAFEDALVATYDDQTLRLSETGLKEAAKVVRNHRLWEIYLIENAAIAPNHVDRDADAVEHVLGEALVAQLETLLPDYQDAKRDAMPGSPHPIVKGNEWNGLRSIRGSS